LALFGAAERPTSQAACVTIADLGSIGELVGAVATVATLAYLAVQIRNSTRVARSASAQSVHESFATWYRMLAGDADLSNLTTKGLRDYASLSESEKGRFVSVAMALLLCSQDAYLKWREGSLSSELWLGWQFVMMNLLLTPGGKSFWKERGYLFGDSFRQHVEGDIMKQTPHPDARPLGAFPLGDESTRDGPT
jgi:hypothetical protein